jgi:lysophospholipase L1-like esterase
MRQLRQMRDLRNMIHSFPAPSLSAGLVNALLLAITFLSCTPSSDTHPFDEDGKEDAGDSISIPIRYLALGDSYTVGESVDEPLRWPNQLADSLNVRLGEGFDFQPPRIVATTGWTTGNLLQGMENAEVDTAVWDLVSLLIGVNNQYQGRPIEEYVEEFSLLLDRAVALAGGETERVFVVSIPDYGYTPFGVNNQATISSELAAFNDTCRALTLARGLAHFDITPISQEWPETAGLVANDGLHPSGLQYSKWVGSFVQEVEDVITP